MVPRCCLLNVDCFLWRSVVPGARAEGQRAPFPRLVRGRTCRGDDCAGNGSRGGHDPLRSARAPPERRRFFPFGSTRGHAYLRLVRRVGHLFQKEAGKTPSTAVSTSTASPFSSIALNFHCETASVAALKSKKCPA